MTDADEERRRADERRRAERRRKREDAAEGVGDAAEAAAGSGCSLPGRGCGGRRPGGRSSRDGDGCDACDLFLLSLHLSAVLHVLAAVLPRRRGTGAVVAVIRGYQRLLSRFTVRCPQTPSCSTYALDAVRASGPRRGLRAAAARISECGSGG